MSENKTQFIEKSSKISFDKTHRSIINFNIDKYKVAVKKGKDRFSDLEYARKQVQYIRQKSIYNLDENLIEFETNFKNNGGELVYANTEKEVIDLVINILQKEDTKYIVKSKSMITEEIELNAALEKNKIESIETDLGEYIVQIADEKPYHIVTPAMHKSKETINELFTKKFDFKENATPEEMTAFVREKLRKKFYNAEVGITGANFLIADTGSIALTENEGNGILTMGFSKLHIVIAGIEKIVKSINNLHTIWPMLSAHGTGQSLTVYNSIVSGPKKADEEDGPDKMYVILLNNNRTKLLEDKNVRDALTCIKCGACLNECPIYRNVGGYTYSSVYSGPIGSVITPYLKNFRDYAHLSFASSLCGKCTESCPAKIPIHDLLLYNRNKYVLENKSFIESMIINAWKYFILKRQRLEIGTSGFKNMALRIFFKKAWGNKRFVPQLSKKSFKKVYEKK